MTRNTILILSLALVVMLGLLALKQRSTIESLRNEVTVATKLAEPAVESADSLPRSVSQVSAPVSSIPDVSQVAATMSATTSVSIALPGTNRDEDVLKEQLQRLQAELEQVKRLVPEPEDATAAYVGPGVWANVDPRTSGMTKIVITGEARGSGTVSTMTIRAWGACSPADCEWPEVPFSLLDRFDDPRLYRRGFAMWEYESGSRTYLLITFEKAGLRIDRVKFRSGKSITPYSVVERMTRIQ